MDLLRNTKNKILLFCYLLLSLIVFIFAALLQGFPGDLPLIVSLVGPTVFLLTFKWLPTSIIYYLIGSLIMAAVFVTFEKVQNDWLRYILNFLLATLWLVIGFAGLIHIGFASV